MKETIIYTLPTCPWSKKLKEWLKKNKHNYEERDLYESQNSLFRDEMLEKSGQFATPVIDIAGKIIVGFQDKKIEAALS